MNWIIYTLKNPRTNEVRYVGWTSLGANRRLNLHIQAAVGKIPTNHRTKWILSMLSAGLRPVMETVESGSGDGWAEAEQRWIAQFREKGARLTNGTDGGEGTLGVKRTPEQIERTMRGVRGKKMSPEHLAKWHAAALLANKGRKLSPEHRAKVAEAGRGRVWSSESRIKLSVSFKGKPLSATHPIKLMTPEQRSEMASRMSRIRWDRCLAATGRIGAQR